MPQASSHAYKGLLDAVVIVIAGNNNSIGCTVSILCFALSAAYTTAGAEGASAYDTPPAA